VAVIGDKSICEISRDDILAFRQWWFDRMKEHNQSYLRRSDETVVLIHHKEAIINIERNQLRREES